MLQVPLNTVSQHEQEQNLLSTTREYVCQKYQRIPMCNGGSNKGNNRAMKPGRILSVGILATNARIFNKIFNLYDPD